MSEFLGVKILLGPSVALPLVILAAAVLAYVINNVIVWALRRAYKIPQGRSTTEFTGFYTDTSFRF